MRKQMSDGMTENQKRKSKKGLCISCRCTSLSKTGNYCYRHAKMRWYEKNPERYAYANLKQNAKRRGKEFNLTFEDFLYFLKLNPRYMKKKGKTINALQIDRIDNLKGYTLENLRSITLKENVIKRHFEYLFSNDPKNDNYVPF